MAKELFAIRELVAPIVGGYWGESADASKGNVRIVRNGDVLESGEVSSESPIRSLGEREKSKAALRSGDIVITMSGNVGRVAFVSQDTDDNGLPYVASNFVKILRANPSVVNSKYLFYFLRSSYFQNELRKHTRGVAIQNLSVRIFDQKLAALPTLQEQERIVGVMNEAEELKRKRREADEKMGVFVAALYEKTFSAGNWQKNKIADLGPKKESIRTGPFGSQLHHDEFTSEGVPVLGIDNVATNVFRWNKSRNLPLEKYIKFKRFRVFPGDVLVTIMGTVGRVCVAPADLPESMSTKHLCVITPDTSKVNPLYLWAALLYDYDVKGQAKSAGKGAIMEGWNSTIIKNLIVSVPPLPLQNEFASKVESINGLRILQNVSAEKIGQLTSALSSKLFAVHS